MTDVNANAEAEASLMKDVGKRLTASVRIVPSLELVRIPACPDCGAPNPKGSDVCPACGAGAPMKTDHRKITPVLTAGAFPWHARVLLRIADTLMRFAEWLQRS